MAHKIHTTSGADTAAACFTDLSLAEFTAAMVADNSAVAGSGGAVTQGTSKATGVELDTVTGKITAHAAALNAATIVAFTLTNTKMLSTDIVVIEHISGGTSGAYTVNAFPSDGSAVISIRNNTAGNLSEAIVLRFSIIRSSDS